MAGKRSGVGVRMTSDNPQLVHTHKLALAVPQSASAVGAVKQYQEGLNTVYFYFSNSAVRYNRLRAVYGLLEDERLITLKQPHAVRWLSLHQAVTAILHS